MTKFRYKNDKLFAESVAVTDLVDNYQTPIYVYSQSAIEEGYLAFSQAFDGYPHLICYAVKANSNLAVLNTLSNLGSGFDIVSIGELKRVLAAGGDSTKCVFSGVLKTAKDIEFALNNNIYCFNVESKSELLLIAKVAEKMQKIAPISLRINPDIDAKTHPYISTGLKDNKFGIDIDNALELYQFTQQHKFLSVRGVDCHIGSQIIDNTPFLDAIDKILAFNEKLENLGIKINHFDFGGGFGIDYEDNQTIDIQQYIQTIISKVNGVKVILEPGRSIVGHAGILLTKVEFLKQNVHKSFAIVDGAMNDLLRPALYQAYHKILPIVKHNQGIQAYWDIVGPICETGDYFGNNRDLVLSEGDYLAIMSVGAYGFVMASNYNTRPMVAEIMVKNDKHKIIRRRQSVEQILATEEICGIN